MYFVLGKKGISEYELRLIQAVFTTHQRYNSETRKGTPLGWTL
jgi:hypothetical protein